MRSWRCAVLSIVPHGLGGKHNTSHSSIHVPNVQVYKFSLYLLYWFDNAFIDCFYFLWYRDIFPRRKAGQWYILMWSSSWQNDLNMGPFDNISQSWTTPSGSEHSIQDATMCVTLRKSSSVGSDKPTTHTWCMPRPHLRSSSMGSAYLSSLSFFCKLCQQFMEAECHETSFLSYPCPPSPRAHMPTFRFQHRLHLCPITCAHVWGAVTDLSCCGLPCITESAVCFQGF